MLQKDRGVEYDHAIVSTSAATYTQATRINGAANAPAKWEEAVAERT